MSLRVRTGASEPRPGCSVGLVPPPASTAAFILDAVVVIVAVVVLAAAATVVVAVVVAVVAVVASVSFHWGAGDGAFIIDGHRCCCYQRGYNR